jgi:tetratricopeptide (TPR) repeat protein
MFRSFIVLGLLYFGPCLSGRCGEEKYQSSPEASPFMVQKLSTTYKFHQDAVWAHLETTVKDHQDGFFIKVVSNTPITGWILRDAYTNESIRKAGLGGEKSFTAEITRSFKVGYRLTVFVKADQEEVPVVVNLSQREGDRESKGLSDAFIPEFEENSDKAYNGMVKNLYRQAVQAYSGGDKSSALNYLNKAVELDPTQPQVQAFRQLVLSGNKESTEGELVTPTILPTKGKGLENSDDLEGFMARAKRAESDGDFMKAKTLYEKVSRMNPERADFSIALKRINRKIALENFQTALQAKNGSKASLAYEKLKGLDPDNPKLADWKKQLEALQSPAQGTDAEAEADRFYNLGFECYRKGDLQGAKKNWEETLKLDPNHPQAIHNLKRLGEEHPELK